MNRHMGGRSPMRDWSTLAEDYAQVKSYAALARRYGCSPSAVEKQAKRQGIKTLNIITGNRGRRVVYDWSNVEEDSKTMSSYQIATKMGCASQTVRNKLAELRRKKNEDS